MSYGLLTLSSNKRGFGLAELYYNSDEELTADSGCWRMNASPPAVRTLMGKLLSSHLCADVVFEINDEDPIFAHKCVLAAASDPMKALVKGAWIENQNDGICRVKASHSSFAISAMLNFIYKDEMLLPQGAGSNVFSEIFDLAAQYELPGLATTCDSMGIKLLEKKPSDQAKYTDMIMYVYEKKNLKKACIEKIASKGPTVMMSGPFMEVKDSYPDIWKKLRKDLGVPDEVV